MEKVKLTKQGKGWLVSRSSTGKQIICNWRNIPEEWDGKELEADFKSGQPIKFSYDGKVIEKQNFMTKKTNLKRRKDFPSNRGSLSSQRNYSKNVAKAPYNFVPINEKVVAAQDIPDEGHSTFNKNRLSGYISLSVEALTPLFIRGNGESFLQFKNRPLIPGSSIRGLIKNLVKIVSYGKFEKGEDFEDKVLYRRGTMPEMKDEKAPKPGFLFWGDESFYIKKAKSIGGKNKTTKEFSYSFSSDRCVFSTGKFGRESQEFIFEVINQSESLKVSNSIRKSYEEDAQRADNVPGVFKCAKTKNVNGVNIPNNLGMPVFYTLKNGAVSSVSHAKYGRIPYSKSISNHIPSDIQNSEIKDFAEAIFGNTEYATRVYFEDAITTDESCEMEPKQPKILSSPKPTSYQLYLEQGREEKRGNKKWDDSDADIRGYKIYWHRKTPNESTRDYSWVEQSGVKTDSHPDPIRAVNPNTKFQGRIRFNNLTIEELGCLLAVLELPPNCYHKLGMAKPLGLGSIKITPNLQIINRENRYKKLFTNELGWDTAIEEVSNLETYKNSFAQYVIEQLGMKKNKSIDDLWVEERLNTLKDMLTWDSEKMDNDAWLKKTDYMVLSEFKKRNILPRPNSVLNKKTN